MFLNCQSVVAKILQKNINFSYCCIVLRYHVGYQGLKNIARLRRKYAGIGLLYPFCFKKLKIGFLDFLGFQMPQFFLY
jgi:hypothetical protein